MLRRTVFAVAATLLLAAPASAQLVGNRVFLEYLYPTVGTVLGTPGLRVVGPTVEYPTMLGFLVNLDVRDTGLFFSFTRAGSFTAATFNGVRLHDIDNTIPDFFSWSILANNMTGFDASRISSTANYVDVNFQGLGFTDQTQVELAMNVVPEPTTVVLMASGMLLVLGTALRRKKVIGV